MDKVDVVYSKRGIEQSRPAIEINSLTGRSIVNLGTYFLPKGREEGSIELRDATAAMHEVFSLATLSNATPLTWSKGDVVVWDNVRALHGRVPRSRSNGPNTRTLDRVWLNRKI